MSEENLIKTNCPECGKSFELDSSLLGQKGKCDACDAKFIIEESIDAAEVSAQVDKVAAVKSSNNKPLILVTLLAVCGALAYMAMNGLSDKTEVQSDVTIEPDVKTENVDAKDNPARTVSESLEKEKEVAKVDELQSLKETFAVKRDFEQIDIRNYRKIYPDVHMGWMPAKAEQAQEALRWGNHLGPLGVRTRSHVPQLQGRAAFAANVPECLRDADGKLALNAAEVVSIAPGSPAEGHLQIGDLIIGIEDEMLLSGDQYRPDWKFMHKDARELQLMLGEKIDQAQARGDVRLTVMRFAANEKQQRLPVSAKELWSGTGGDKSVGAQDFDIEITGEGYVTLESGQFDENIHGDGTIWMDVVVEGDYGSKSLLELPWENAKAGYGRPHLVLDEVAEFQGKSYSQILNLHAHGTVQWLLPKGTKRIKGSFAAVSYGKVQPKIYLTNLALPLTGVHKEKVVELRFPIGKTGSFSKTYPKNCPKTDLTVRRHTEWLAAQQRDDGSWPRLTGYTRDGWDTAFCGLALMSSGDEKYAEQIRRAAYRVAYADGPSEWIAERAMRLIFLSEYYLRTKDEKILAGVQSAYSQVLDCCKTDYMSGHKVNGFGYGIAGQHYGTGHLVLAVALAKQTPIVIDEDLVNNIIRHAGEVCVNGHYAYGRGRRLARSDKRKMGGGNAMSGSGMLGAVIGGGHASSIREYAERMEASIGDGDNSHATSSLAYIFGTLSIACADEEVYLKHMQNFKYKMTIDDNWEGGFLKSAFPLDFQGGEGVTANWIRSAGYILSLNAVKKNMAITGKKEFWSKESVAPNDEVAVSEWGGQIHSYYLRNWCLANELLGAKAPAEIAQTIKLLQALPRDINLVPATKKLVVERAPAIINTIAKNTTLSDIQRGYAIELICGLDFKIYDEMKGANQEVKLIINQPFHQLNWLEDDKEAMYSSSPLKLQAKVEITAGNLAEKIEFEANGIERFDLDKGTRTLTAAKPIKNAAEKEFKGEAKVSFKIGETQVSYVRKLQFNTTYFHSNHFNLRRLQLKLRMAPRAYFQSQPLMISGIAFDCMYPQERMISVIAPEGSALSIHEGDEVMADLASENFICAWVHVLKFTKPSQVKNATPANSRMVTGTMTGDMKNLHDFQGETVCEFQPSNGKSVIEYDFGKAVTLNGLDTDHRRFIRIWCKQGEQWVPVIWDNYTPHTSHNPRFPDTTAQLWRVEIQHRRKMNLHTLRFYQNPNRIIKHDGLIQLKDPKFQPALSAE